MGDLLHAVGLKEPFHRLDQVRLGLVLRAPWLAMSSSGQRWRSELGSRRLRLFEPTGYVHGGALGAEQLAGPVPAHALRRLWKTAPAIRRKVGRHRPSDVAAESDAGGPTRGVYDR